MATPNDISELLAKLAEERSAFLAGVEGLTEEAAEVRRPDQDGEAGWSPKEQFSHLAEMELSYLATAQRAVTGEEIEQRRPRYPQTQAHSATVAQHLEELSRLRDQTVNYIHFLTPEEFDARVISGAFPEMSVLQWLRSYYRHDRMHFAQIEGRQSDYQPRFVGGEPDQRRRG